MYICESCSIMSNSLWPHGLYSPWNSPGQNTGVGSIPFARGSSQPRDQTQVCHIACGFFTSWATRSEVKWSEVAQSCPTLCNTMDCSPLGSSVHGISQARILEWVAISFSRGSSRLRDQTCVSCVGRRILYHWATWEAQCMYTYGWFTLLYSRNWHSNVNQLYSNF